MAGEVDGEMAMLKVLLEPECVQKNNVVGQSNGMANQLYTTHPVQVDKIWTVEEPFSMPLSSWIKSRAKEDKDRSDDLSSKGPSL
mgnify:FL=1